MASYLLCGLDVVSRRVATYIYPPPYYWHLVDGIPEPTREYTVVLSTNWPQNPLFHHPSLATFLKNARLVETDELWYLRSFYEGENVLFCEHLAHSKQVSIMRSESGYLFLCPHCVAIYAINGIPDLPETLFQALSPQLVSNFPNPPTGDA